MQALLSSCASSKQLNDARFLDDDTLATGGEAKIVGQSPATHHHIGALLLALLSPFSAVLFLSCCLFRRCGLPRPCLGLLCWHLTFPKLTTF